MDVGRRKKLIKAVKNGDSLEIMAKSLVAVKMH